MRLWFLALACSLVACGKNEKPPEKLDGPGTQETGPNARRAPDPNAAVEAKQMFFTVCAQCHGPDGTGNGPAAESLDPKPRNYTDAVWQASVKDEDIQRIIVEGGQAVGKSAMMPANPKLKTQPDVVAELVKIIRGFAKK